MVNTGSSLRQAESARSNGMDAPTLKRHQRAKVEVFAAT